MVEVIKYGPEVQKEIMCSKCKSQLRFLNSDIRSMEDICPWDNDHGYWAKSVKEAKAVINCYERNMTDECIYINLDHDAGDYFEDGGDYIEILKWLEEFKIPDTTYLFGLHTQNPVGRMNMKAIIEHNNWRLI